MSEFLVYGKDGYFHNIVKQSRILNGRYAVLPKGTVDINTNNVLSGIELPKGGKYPAVFCLPPYSTIESAQANHWESFIFRLLFLCTSGYTGDNQIKRRDPATNTSLHSVPQDWSEMKALAMEFINALEVTFSRSRGIFRLSQKENYRISRAAEVHNDKLSGVMLTFSGSMPVECVYSDIDPTSIVIPVQTHEPNHFH
jgi:hypothetical protein